MENPKKLAKKYVVRHRIKTCTNITVHQEGEYLNPIKIHNMSGLYGTDRQNKFYTKEFLENNPQTFERIG